MPLSIGAMRVRGSPNDGSWRRGWSVSRVPHASLRAGSSDVGDAREVRTVATCEVEKLQRVLRMSPVLH